MLSWIAFAHAIIVLAVALNGTHHSLPIPTSEVDRFYRDDLSMVSACEQITAHATSPVTWLLSYVVAESSKISPWKK